MKVPLTPEQRRARRLATYMKYNTSTKGKDRYKKYEDAHPERAGNRWEPARNALRAPDPEPSSGSAARPTGRDRPP
jgi:hypothetical protein